MSRFDLSFAKYVILDKTAGAVSKFHRI